VLVAVRAAHRRRRPSACKALKEWHHRAAWRSSVCLGLHRLFVFLPRMSVCLCARVVVVRSCTLPWYAYECCAGFAGPVLRHRLSHSAQRNWKSM
jgi:hypothetical protein